MSEYFTMDLNYGEPRTSIKLEIKKFNRNSQLCYYDSVDLSCKNFTDEQIEIISKLFISANFKVDIGKHTYFGIYDPSRVANLVEIYPTDVELLEKEMRLNKIYYPKRKKIFGIF